MASSRFSSGLAFSLRHFYAVNALRNGIGVFEVACNMGTSVQIIQEYYGRRRCLLGGWKVIVQAETGRRPLSF
jgi:hypothetical protein